jgi:transcription elongation factor GreA
MAAISAIIVTCGSDPRAMTDIKKKLQDEITTLEHEMHVELPREILKARAHGDLSENAEYHAAKERQGFVNARLNQLKNRLAEMSMVDFSKIPHGKVGLGSTVVVLDLKRDEEITYNLVTTEEADAANGKISTTSPIGRALLGKEEGDSVRVQSPGGVKELEIRKLTTIHDTVE